MYVGVSEINDYPLLPKVMYSWKDVCFLRILWILDDEAIKGHEGVSENLFQRSHFVKAWTSACISILLHFGREYLLISVALHGIIAGKGTGRQAC